ncbi:MAG TPA: glucans biosynthesis glucosyltransferase MdoH [Opitutaceae bacterium]|nr:glucans biosynthesis glucosyltransferase MdoH [Opitutaceae bacterium]
MNSPLDQIPSGLRLRRRALVGLVTAGLAAPGLALMADLHWRTGFDGWKTAHLVLFAILLGLVAFGCTQALVGFVARRGRGDRWRLGAIASSEMLPPGATAVVMPVYNEDARRVFAGLRVIYESIRATGHLDAFHFYVLSDSTDPNRWVDEEAAWAALVREFDAASRLFYRRRRINTNKKAGNIADFCRRWGGAYRYMIVLDADSLMSGATVVQLVRLMERSPRTGLIQTIPRLIRGETPFARWQQFASRLYGPVFQAGLDYWQLNESNYWGHNAIVRLAPFIEHCSLPELPGFEPFGGRILSHDYVEAALLVRAGWGVRLAVGLEGSYEECPATLIDFAKRDRRWLQGNLQHSWLLAAQGLRPASRLHLLLGILAYGASPMWFAFLLLSTLLLHRQLATGLTLVPRDSLLDFLNLAFRTQAGILFGGTMALLFVPKLLALLDLALVRGAKEFGGWARTLGGAFVETLASALIAPVLMFFHSKFIFWTLLGRGVAWVTQRRGGDGTPDWREAILTHAGQTGLALLWGGAALSLDPVFFLWLSPVLVGPVCSIPLSLVTAQPPRPGSQPRLWATPEARRPPAVAALLEQHLSSRSSRAPVPPEYTADYGLLQAVLDPYVNAVHVSLLREKRLPDDDDGDRFAELRERLTVEGPAALSTRDKLALLMDAQSMIRLHREIWSRPAAALAPWWQRAMQQYNQLAPAPTTALDY